MNKIDELYFKTVADIQDESFDYIVIGGGAYGASFAHRMLEENNTARVLVLEKGSYLIPDHIQNIPPAYIDLNSSTGVRPWSYTGTQNLDFMPQIPFVGGRALYWNAWTPQPDSVEMPDWPAAMVDGLNAQWESSKYFMGVRDTLETAGNQNRTLAEFARARLFANLDSIDMARPQSDASALKSSMATGQDVARENFAKFAPVSVLVDDVQKYDERFSVVVEAEVIRLATADGSLVTSVETVDGNIDVGSAQIIMACNTLEAGFILARSFPEEPLIGKNLCGHIRSWLAARVPADEVPALTDQLQATAMYMPGQDKQTGRLMHTHISVVHNPHPEDSKDTLYQILPDASSQQAVDTYQDPRYVVVMLHSMGEFLGERSEDSWNYVGVDSFGNAQLHIEMREEDEAFWRRMDEATYQVLQALVCDAADVEYQDEDGNWNSEPPQSIRNKGLVHESGTLWMGDDSETSVTNSLGQMHRHPNVFGIGSMLFPRPGSCNPTLTGVAQAFSLVDFFSK